MKFIALLATVLLTWLSLYAPVVGDDATLKPAIAETGDVHAILDRLKQQMISAISTSMLSCPFPLPFLLAQRRCVPVPRGVTVQGVSAATLTAP